MVEVSSRLPARLRAPFVRARTVVENSLWVAPTAAGLLAAVIAAVLLAVDVEVTGRLGGLTLFVQSASAAENALSAIVSATIAATSLVFTGTVVALQLATGQYSPRLLRDVLTDHGIRWVLSGMVGTVVYDLLVLRQLPDDDDLPVLATLLGFALGFLVVGLLVYFLHHLMGLLRLETIVERVTRNTLAAIDTSHPADADDPFDPDVPDDARRIVARRSGYVQAAGLSALAKAAEQAGCHLRLRPSMGQFLVEGTTAAWAWPTEVDEPPDDEQLTTLAGEVDTALALGAERTVPGDVAYGMRHLVDIALRGVSPGVNDPTTATQCIHHLTRVLVQLADRPLHNRVARSGPSAAVVAQPGLAAYVDLAQTQVLAYGGSDAHVVAALITQMRDVAEAGTSPLRQEVVREQVERLHDDAADRVHPPIAKARLDAAFARAKDALEGVADDGEVDAS